MGRGHSLCRLLHIVLRSPIHFLVSDIKSNQKDQKLNRHTNSKKYYTNRLNLLFCDIIEVITPQKIRIIA